MAETPKVLSALLAQLPDNTTGLISPEDIRDAVVSLFPSRGQLDLTASASTTPNGSVVGSGTRSSGPVIWAPANAPGSGLPRIAVSPIDGSEPC